MKLVQLAFLINSALLAALSGCVPKSVTVPCPVPPTIVTSSSPALVLKNELAGMIARELLPYSVAAIKVVSLKSGATLYENNPYQLMPAASVQKVFTAAAALSRLGPDHTIETSLSVSADHKTLYLRGCGDPLLKTTDLKQMVSDLSDKLPPGRQYELVGDSSCFDDAYWGSGWMWDDEPGPEAMYLSALAVNGNTVRVTVSPGKASQSTMKVSTEPATRYVTINNTGKTGQPGGPCAVTVTRPAGDRDNTIRVTGSLAPGCHPVSRRLTVWRPELYTLTLLAEQLEDAGIKAAPLTMGLTPPGAAKLAVVRHPVSEIVSVMLKNSDNLSAENLLKYLSHAKSGQSGSAAEGAVVIKEYLRGKGIPADRLVIADGSGVSRYNLASADTITRLLVAAYKDQSISKVFLQALPVAGRDGTLAGRMKGTAAEGNVKAKTGTMKGVSALAGYTVTADGEPLAFSMIMQNFIGSGQQIRCLQDRIAVLLSSYSSARGGGYGLPKAGSQQPDAAGYGISDNYSSTDVFHSVPH